MNTKVKEDKVINQIREGHKGLPGHVLADKRDPHAPQVAPQAGLGNGLLEHPINLGKDGAPLNNPNPRGNPSQKVAEDAESRSQPEYAHTPKPGMTAKKRRQYASTPRPTPGTA